MMKNLIALILIVVMTVSLASCEFFTEVNGGEITSTTTTTVTSTSSTTTRPTTKPTTTTTNNGQGNTPSDDHIYNAFTASEKQTMKEILGEVIPFIPNDEYYFDDFSEDNGDGTSTIGINFYTFGNTQAEFDAYRNLFSDYDYVGTEDDEYGDAWYYYDSTDGTYCVDISFYYYEGDYVVDVYAYCISESGNNGGNGGNGGSTDTEHIYTEFTDEENDLFRKYAGTSIFMIANDEYYVEEYTLPYGDGTGEYGVNFYTFGNTQEEFDYYKSIMDWMFDYDGSEVDEYGDTWYYYTVDYDVYLDMVYYYYDGDYVVDVYVYYIDEMDENSGSGSGNGSGSGSTDTNEDVITNAGAGLPSDSDGVFDVDFTKAENVKDVTDQGYYLDGCPTTGAPAVLVIPVEFKDATAASKGYTTDALENAFYKNGKNDYFSVYDYYYISSYGQLTLDITVLDEWFCPQYNSYYYYNYTYDYYGEQVAIGDQLIMDEALAYLEDKMDLSKYDSDDNGIIDAVVLVNTLDVGEEDFYWAYRYWNIYTDEYGYYYEYDGVSANDYIWASYQFLNETYDSQGNTVYEENVMNTYTFIHEFAHVLGVDDYYDTSYQGSPLDGADIMDSMLGDHNAFTKFNLGWITNSRLVVTEGSITLKLEDFSKNGDTIIIANNWDEKLGAYQEYYILVYYKNVGLNEGEGAGYFSREGVVVYHINASLYKEVIDGEIYYDIYNNNTDVLDPNGYGTKDNLIEYVKSSNDTFTYVEGDTLPKVVDDNEKVLGYTFVIDEITSEYATITFTLK